MGDLVANADKVKAEQIAATEAQKAAMEEVKSTKAAETK